MNRIKNIAATATTAATLLAVASLGLSVAVHAETDQMPSGLWQITVKMEMPGMPPEMAAKMGNRVMTHCVKPGEARKWSEQKNQPDRGPQKCETIDKKVDGNQISWKLKCENGTTGDGTVTHNGKDAYTMVNNINSPRGSVKMEMAGKKIADTCEAGK